MNLASSDYIIKQLCKVHEMPNILSHMNLLVPSELDTCEIQYSILRNLIEASYGSIN